MSAIHIKIIDGNGRRLLEMTQHHSRSVLELAQFLDRVEELVEKLSPANRPTKVGRE